METLLIIEDNRSFRRLLCIYLLQLGYRVLEAGTLTEALQALAVHPECAGILLDLSLPDTRDIEAIALLSQAAPTLPLGVLTGRDDVPEVRVLDQGAKLFMHKNNATRESLGLLVQALLGTITLPLPPPAEPHDA